jgi:hypothetical protein
LTAGLKPRRFKKGTPETASREIKDLYGNLEKKPQISPLRV